MSGTEETKAVVEELVEKVEDAIEETKPAVEELVKKVEDVAEETSSVVRSVEKAVSGLKPAILSASQELRSYWNVFATWCYRSHCIEPPSLAKRAVLSSKEPK
jgi:t-SNARE complex subunit (syntaxin)